MRQIRHGCHATYSLQVCQHAMLLPRRFLSFYICVWRDALPLQIEITNQRKCHLLQIVYVGEDILQEGGVFSAAKRRALPTRCSLNGKSLHDARPLPEKTEPLRYHVDEMTEKIVLTWDVDDRSLVTYACVPVPVADVRLLP